MWEDSVVASNSDCVSFGKAATGEYRAVGWVSTRNLNRFAWRWQWSSAFASRLEVWLCILALIACEVFDLESNNIQIGPAGTRSFWSTELIAVELILPELELDTLLYDDPISFYSYLPRCSIIVDTTNVSLDRVESRYTVSGFGAERKKSLPLLYSASKGLTSASQKSVGAGVGSVVGGGVGSGVGGVVGGGV